MIRVGKYVSIHLHDNLFTVNKLLLYSITIMSWMIGYKDNIYHIYYNTNNEYRWRYPSWILALGDEPDQIQFRTHHRVCDGCVERASKLVCVRNLTLTCCKFVRTYCVVWPEFRIESGHVSSRALKTITSLVLKHS